MRTGPLRPTLRITKAVSDLQRLRILMMLKHGELCACQIVEVLSLAPSTVSKHLSILSDAGLVDMRKESRWAYFRLSDDPLEVSAHTMLKWLEDAIKDDPVIRQDSKKLQAITAIDPEILCRNQRKR